MAVNGRIRAAVFVMTGVLLAYLYACVAFSLLVPFSFWKNLMQAVWFGSHILNLMATP